MILLAIFGGTASPQRTWQPRGWQHTGTYTGSGRRASHVAQMRATPAEFCVTCSGDGLLWSTAFGMRTEPCPTCGGSGKAS